MENGGIKDSYTIGEVVQRLRPEFPSLSVSKIRYLERRRLINLSRTRGGYRLFSNQDVELLRYILTLQDKEYLPLKVIKKRIEGGAPVPTGDSSAGDLSSILDERVYTRDELADTLETETRFVDDLIAVGVIGRTGELTQRDAEIVRGERGHRIRDVGSLNGTYVNRVRVDAVDLRNGDEIQIGKYRFKFVFA